MLLVPLCVFVFGLCATESAAQHSKPHQDSTETYKMTLKMLRRSATLRLLMYSPEIRNKTPECLISHFIKRKSDRVRRTLETNSKSTERQGIKLNTTVSIFVRNRRHPYLQVLSKEDPLRRLWSDAQYLEYAEPKECFILKAAYHDEPRPPCVLWGYKCTFKCQRRFVEVCGRGRPVDLRDCTQTEKEKDQKISQCR
uniref:Putative secreted protein 94 n=1 Tax=Amblyomma aureolatum TaxID=187763 RepID=A0A1E1X1S2_9ACAR